ncbi:MAG: hypothetical protein L0Y72_13800 [Gemmataceae bacterium]|nr:hypothetical protein [Gemmataceae bacterium]MCI0740115.1 hypothetical protein [Gemmataceae bacterium]
MKKLWLALVMAQATWLTSLHAGQLPVGGASAIAEAPAGYLVVPIAPTTLGVISYRPQPGDILLYTNFKYERIFQLAGIGAPTHSAIVFARPDGTPAILELTAPQFWRAKVRHLDVGTRLRDYEGPIMVRQPRTPLSPEQSAALTRFAMPQEGKDFALGRFFLQATPFCCRTGLRRLVFGHSFADRSRWICSEIVVVAAAHAGLLDPRAFPANAMYPSDLAYDQAYDLSAAFLPPVLWTPHPNPTWQDSGDALYRTFAPGKIAP